MLLRGAWYHAFHQRWLSRNLKVVVPMARLQLWLIVGIWGLASVSSVAAAAEAEIPKLPERDWQPGRGFELPLFGLRLGGYVSINYEALQGEPGKLEFDDLTAFLSGDWGQRWSFFSEWEIGDAVYATKNEVSTDDWEYDLERLYVRYRLQSRWDLLLGKYLTPVGRLNQLHATPLVYTVTRPYTTFTPFARHSSGAMLKGNIPLAGGDSLDLKLFADATNSLDPTQPLQPAFHTEPEGGGIERNSASDYGIGMRLRYRTSNDRLNLGLSTMRYSMDKEPHAKTLLGADVLWQDGGLELSAEGIYRASDGDGGAEWGGFGKAVAPLPGVKNVFAVGMAERFKPQRLDAVSTGALGAVYEPVSGMKFKLERRESWGNEPLSPDGWLASFDLLI